MSVLFVVGLVLGTVLGIFLTIGRNVYSHRFSDAQLLSSRGYVAELVYRFPTIKEGPYWVWRDKETGHGFLFKNAVKRERMRSMLEFMRLPPPEEPKVADLHEYKTGTWQN